jgi:hypothetical protein
LAFLLIFISGLLIPVQAGRGEVGWAIVDGAFLALGLVMAAMAEEQ